MTSEPLPEWDDDDPYCAHCGNSVHVDSDHEFHEGDLCNQCLYVEYPKMKQRATDAEAERDKLRDAYRHYQSVKQQGKSEFIKENGRFGGSPWAELCDAIEQLTKPKG